GWCLNYFFYSFDLKWGADTQNFFFNNFLELSDSPTKFGGIRMPIFTTTLFVWFVCWVICYRDVSHGIEKACLVFMPILFGLTIILVIWTLTLDGAPSSIWERYIKPDFSKIIFWSTEKPFWDIKSWNFNVWTDAFSQIFFTLSLGFGIMITYASYLPEKTDITKNAYLTSFINCIYSLIAGTIVFGTIGFMAKEQGVEFADVIKSGPQLAFVVYPKAISLLPWLKQVFGAMFFLVLVIAGISSGISLIEAFTCALTDKFSWSRKKTVTIVCFLGFLGSILFTTRSGLLLLDIVDHFATNYGLVAGGILECVIVGWILKAKVLRKHVNGTGGVKINIIWDIAVRYITPLVLVVLLFLSIKTDLSRNYGGYDTDSLLIFGINWMLVCMIAAVALTFYPWRPERLERKHRPEEDELLV
ncbi:MAG: sodium-dependent transporter, partial [Candidatus Aureabacteria bacterium]|nr:sodium-dependent transporter [Candidatus Auribacterota bacterium]